jgi:hypothetical protein
MNLKPVLGAVAALAVVAAVAVAAELKSGLEPGTSIGAFNVVKCAGPDDGVALGTELCYRCKYGGQPMVMVFTRTADEQVAELVKQLDHELAEHSDKKLAAFVNLLGEDRETLESEAKKFAGDVKAEHVPIVVPVEFENGPADYGINPEAQITVLVAHKGKVTANHAIGADGLDEATVKAILEDVEKIVE